MLLTLSEVDESSSKHIYAGNDLGLSRVLESSYCTLHTVLIEIALDSAISFIVNSLDSFFIIPARKFLEILEYFLTSVVLVEKDLLQTLHIKRCLSR